MPKINKRNVFALFCFGGAIWAQSLWLGGARVGVELIGDVVTFLSIVFGFYIASFSIFVTSKYVADLYQIPDADSRNRTLLHTLVRNYRIGLLLVLISIGYFLAVDIFLNGKADGLPLSDPILLPLVAILLCNFWYSYRMMDVLGRIVLQEAKRTK